MKRQSPRPVRSTGLQGVSLIGAALVVAAAYHPWLAFAGVASQMQTISKPYSCLGFDMKFICLLSEIIFETFNEVVLLNFLHKITSKVMSLIIN